MRATTSSVSPSPTNPTKSPAKPPPICPPSCGHTAPHTDRQCPPLIDHPYDKATSEFLITAPAHYQVVSNGLLLEHRDLPEGRRHTHWKQSVPIASWLNTIAAAPFSVRHLPPVKGIPLETWVFPGDRDNGILTFDA